MTDYCTLWPEGWWARCCQIHDLEYAVGLDRGLSDYNLFVCVSNSNETIITVIIASIMYIGVRVGGWLFHRKVNEHAKS